MTLDAARPADDYRGGDVTIDPVAAAAAALRRDPRRLWALVRHVRATLYADGLITIDECAALLDDEAGA